jgi:hypothetical protein
MNACEQHRVVNQIIAWKKQKWEMLRYVWKFFLHFQFLDLASLRVRMCSVPERGGIEWNGSVPRSRDGFDPVFGSEKNEERNGSIPVFGFGMG